MSYSLDRVETLDYLTENKEAILKWIDVALTKTPEETRESILGSILKGVSTLWVVSYNSVIIGVVITEIMPHPAQVNMLIHMLGGRDIDKWVSEISKIEEYAKELGCNNIEIYGRPAWKKLLPDYSNTRVVLIKELT